MYTLKLPGQGCAYYRPQRSWGKVMFLQASVILLTGREGIPHPPDYIHPPGLHTPPDYIPPTQTVYPLNYVPPSRTTYPPDYVPPLDYIPPQTMYPWDYIPPGTTYPRLCTPGLHTPRTTYPLNYVPPRTMYPPPSPDYIPPQTMYPPDCIPPGLRTPLDGLCAGGTHPTRMHFCFPEFLQNFSECQILWSLCLVIFHALTLKLPIQTSLSVAPKLPVSLRSGEKCENFRKTSTARDIMAATLILHKK